MLDNTDLRRFLLAGASLVSSIAGASAQTVDPLIAKLNPGYQETKRIALKAPPPIGTEFELIVKGGTEYEKTSIFGYDHEADGLDPQDVKTITRTHVDTHDQANPDEDNVRTGTTVTIKNGSTVTVKWREQKPEIIETMGFAAKGKTFRSIVSTTSVPSDTYPACAEAAADMFNQDFVIWQSPRNKPVAR